MWDQITGKNFSSSLNLLVCITVKIIANCTAIITNIDFPNALDPLAFQLHFIAASSLPSYHYRLILLIF